jgi:hypothetical protein
MFGSYGDKRSYHTQLISGTIHKISFRRDIKRDLDNI